MPTEQVTLSGLIRKGARMVKRQCQGEMFIWAKGDDYPIAACVLGAALLGTGTQPLRGATDLDPLERAVGYDRVLWSDVMVLNDARGLSFEEIAQWLEEMEVLISDAQGEVV